MEAISEYNRQLPETPYRDDLRTTQYPGTRRQELLAALTALT